MLSNLISSLNNLGIIPHAKFLDELRAIILKFQGTAASIFQQLHKQLGYIASLGKDCYRADHNEILSHTNGCTVYSLHINSQNIRLLASLNPNNGNFIFLAAFREISGKSKTDYSTHIASALERFNEITGGGYCG